MPPARGVATAQGERLMAPERVARAKPKQLRPGSERIGGNFHSMVQPCLKAKGWDTARIFLVLQRVPAIFSGGGLFLGITVSSPVRWHALCCNGFMSAFDVDFRIAQPHAFYLSWGILRTALSALHGYRSAALVILVQYPCYTRTRGDWRARV